MSPQEPRPKEILIIDDDLTLVVPLKDGLESAGFHVDVAFDAEQGLALSRVVTPDLIILDYYMPGGNGGWVYEKLREAVLTENVPVVFSTGLTIEELHTKVKSGAKTYFLKKPVGLNGILAIVNQVLGIDASAPPSKREKLFLLGTKPEDPKPLARYSEFEVRVSYADTDKLGIIYYANYLKYFEQGRTELLRSLGVRYRDLEIQRKLYLPAVDVRVQYLSPSRYDDLLTVRTWISEMGRASVSFECDIIDKDLTGLRVARGSSRHAVVNDLWRTTRIPADLKTLLSPFVGQGPRD